jgi:hypothetical protein
MKKKFITADEFDKKFENDEDITAFLDLKNVSKPGLEQKRVSVDFPVWMIRQLDIVARRLGVTRQSIIKVYISEKLKENVV